MLLHLTLLIMISMSELANERPTAFDPKREMLVVGKREDIKNAMNW